MADLSFLGEGNVLILMQLVFKVDRLTAICVIAQRADLPLEMTLLLEVFLVISGQLPSFITGLLRELLLVRLQLLSLLLDDLELGIEDEFLAFDLKALLGQLLKIPIKVAPHLRILVLQQADMLVRGLVIIVEATDAGLLLVLDHLLTQDFQLELHEVDLLLQVDDVVIGRINVRVLTELAGSLLLLLLTSEIHGDGRLVAAAISETAAAKVASALERATNYNFQIQI